MKKATASQIGGGTRRSRRLTSQPPTITKIFWRKLSFVVDQTPFVVPYIVKGCVARRHRPPDEYMNTDITGSPQTGAKVHQTDTKLSVNWPHSRLAQPWSLAIVSDRSPFLSLNFFPTPTSGQPGKETVNLSLHRPTVPPQKSPCPPGHPSRSTLAPPPPLLTHLSTPAASCSLLHDKFFSPRNDY